MPTRKNFAGRAAKIVCAISAPVLYLYLLAPMPRPLSNFCAIKCTLNPLEGQKRTFLS